MLDRTGASLEAMVATAARRAESSYDPRSAAIPLALSARFPAFPTPEIPAAPNNQPVEAAQTTESQTAKPSRLTKAQRREDEAKARVNKIIFEIHQTQAGDPPNTKRGLGSTISGQRKLRGRTPW